MNKIAFNVSILTDKPSGVGVYTLNLFSKIKSTVNDVDFDVYELQNRNIKMLSLYRMFWNIFILPWLTRKSRLVFSFSSHGSPFIKNQIITVHDLISLNFPGQHRTQYLYFKYILPSILRSCVRIVAISEFTKSELVKYYGISEDKISVIHNGTNYIGFKQSKDAQGELMQLTKGKPYFLCVGAAYSHKNIHRLIEAIDQTDTDYLFVIVGKENAYFNTVREKVKEMKLANVILLDYISAPLLNLLYKEAICNIYISLYEGFGFPPLEAANYNTISIVSAIPVMKEIYGDAVVYADPYEARDIANKIEMVAKRQIDLNSLRNRFPLLLATYTWEKTADKTIELIHEHTSKY